MTVDYLSRKKENFLQRSPSYNQSYSHSIIQLFQFPQWRDFPEKTGQAATLNIQSFSFSLRSPLSLRSLKSLKSLRSLKSLPSPVSVIQFPQGRDFASLNIQSFSFSLRSPLSLRSLKSLKSLRSLKSLPSPVSVIQFPQGRDFASLNIQSFIQSFNHSASLIPQSINRPDGSSSFGRKITCKHPGNY